jgi:GNAT superfamily N-acetyltransferase
MDKRGTGYTYPTESLDEVDVRKFTNGHLHKEFSRDELAAVAGAQPGSHVVFLADDEGLTVLVTFMGEDGFPIGEATRSVTLNTIRNEEFELQPGFRGKGLGLKILTQQVEEGAKHGFQYIETHATGLPAPLGGRPEFYRNGYYTWAVMGFDGVPERTGPNGEKWISEIIEAPGGPAWWKANGSEFMGTFLLQNSSKSRRVLDGYRQLKGRV